VSSRVLRLVPVCLVMLLLLGVAVRDQLSARLTGTDVTVRVGVFDPIDPFRGAYVSLGYPDLPGLGAGGEPQQQELREGDVFLPLERRGTVWVGREPLTMQPDSGVFLRCNSLGFRVDCGIGTFFLPQGKAAGLEQELREGTAVATIRVDSFGHAALMGVR
jgi:uncharacterized membrane-anchored protein